jgi:hypothetical protein
MIDEYKKMGMAEDGISYSSEPDALKCISCELYFAMDLMDRASIGKVTFDAESIEKRP